MKVLILTYSSQDSYPSWKAELICSYFMVEFLTAVFSADDHSHRIVLTSASHVWDILSRHTYSLATKSISSGISASRSCSIWLPCPSKWPLPTMFCLLNNCVVWVMWVDHLVCFSGYQPSSRRGLSWKRPCLSQIFVTASLCSSILWSAVSFSSTRTVTLGLGLTPDPCLFILFLLLTLNLLPTEQALKPG